MYTYVSGVHPWWLRAGVLGVVLGAGVDRPHPQGRPAHAPLPVAQDVAVGQRCHRGNRWRGKRGKQGRVNPLVLTAPSVQLHRGCCEDKRVNPFSTKFESFWFFLMKIS